MPHHKPMVPADFVVPNHIATEHFVVRPLLASDAEPDYEAWSTSIEHLTGIFGPGSDWPTTKMTVEENAIDLAWHQRENETASSFAFTVLDRESKRCLGCIYLSPARKLGYEVEVFYWVRQSEVDNGLDDTLGRFVRAWVSDAWPFDSVVYPGRDIEWSSYTALPDQPHW